MRKDKTTLGIIDAQSVKNANTAEEKGYDAGKKVPGIKRHIELHKFVVLPKRWIVERTFGWLDKFRRRWKNCERKLHTSSQMLVFALISILIKRF